MKLHPWDDCCKQAVKFIEQGHDVYQQFSCMHCGAKQTMDTANVFHELGRCEECNGITNIRQRGMNYMLHARLTRRD